MAQHATGTRQEWLAARLDLLEAEKELTRRSDELAARRLALPWVRVDKAYRFETEEGSVSLPDLFRGRSQLLVYHLMFGPEYSAACPSCSMIADGFNGFAVHLANHDVTLHAVSRAPLPPAPKEGAPGVQCAMNSGVDWPTFLRERPGMSAFVLDNGAVYHTYSTFSRGLDALWGSYQWLDRAPLGRNEKGVWWRRHDEYGK